MRNAEVAAEQALAADEDVQGLIGLDDATKADKACAQEVLVVV